MPTGSPDRRERNPDVRRRARERSLGERDRAVPRGLVLPEAREGRRPQVTVLRELQEVDLRDDLGAGPEGHVRVHDLRFLVEGAGSLEPAEPFVDRPSADLGEPRPPPAEMDETAFLVGPEDEGSERVAPLPLARRDPADDAVEGRLLLDLHPVLAPRPRPLPARLALRDDALPTPREDHVVVVHASGRDDVAQDDMVVDRDEVVEDRLPFEEGS